MDLHYLDLSTISGLIRAGEVSCLDVTNALLDRIETLDPTLLSYVTVLADDARAQAKAADALLASGDWKGPLHGIPLAAKDLFAIKGVRWAAGMPLRKDVIADADATAIRRLKDAGAVILGTLKMTEGAHADHRPPLFPAPINPWNADLWSGASSSGSGVAPAAGLCFGALGTETGGSIRLPSAANGVTGFKPTWSRVSLNGVFELSLTLDHVGALARSAVDAATIVGAIAGQDDADTASSWEPVPDMLGELREDLKGVRIGLDADLAFERVDAEVCDHVKKAIETLRDLGAEIVEVKIPGAREIVESYLPISAVQTAVAHRETFPSRREEYGPALTNLLELGHKLTGMEYQDHILKRIAFGGTLRQAMRDVDFIVLPLLGFRVPTVAEMAVNSDEVIEGVVRFTSPFAISGSPAISMPCGFDTRGAPVVFQLIGKHFREPPLVAAANAYQRATDWNKRRPPLDA